MQNDAVADPSIRSQRNEIPGEECVWAPWQHLYSYHSLSKHPRGYDVYRSIHVQYVLHMLIH